MPCNERVLHIRHLGLQAYGDIWQQMQCFTDQRNAQTDDEIWLVQHPPVFTLGKNAKPGHVLNPGDIPVVQVDRGGQVTYHGPGQLLMYTLLDITRLNIGVRQLVTCLETSVVNLLAQYGITSASKPDAPGIYVEGKKIAALGLRVRKGRCFHGLALNIDMDLAPFKYINPCGYAGLEVTQVSDLTDDFEFDKIAWQLTDQLKHQLSQSSNKIFT